jgi:hypothetical protein
MGPMGKHGGQFVLARAIGEGRQRRPCSCDGGHPTATHQEDETHAIPGGDGGVSLFLIQSHGRENPSTLAPVACYSRTEIARPRLLYGSPGAHKARSRSLV